jgi:hypothetical protein
VVVEAEGVTDGVVVTDVDGVGVGAVDDGVWVGVLVEVLERGDGVDGEHQHDRQRVKGDPCV